MLSIPSLLDLVTRASWLASSFTGRIQYVTSDAGDGRVRCPDGNLAPHDACCPFYALRDDLQANLFKNQCGEDTHEALRLTFHDAIGYSSALKKEGKYPGGGADGSILVFRSEANFPDNHGLEDFISSLFPYLSKYPEVSPGDLVQFAGAVGITNCPGAPRLQFLAGRPEPTEPSPCNGLLPKPEDNVDKIIARFADGGEFEPHEIVALLASHSIAHAGDVRPPLEAPLDTTPCEFDTQIFLEVLLKGVGLPGTGGNQGGPGEVESPLPSAGELRLQSDFALARDGRTACTWQGFINEQEKMSTAFAAAMAKLAVNAQDVSQLVDCSEVIPKATPPVRKYATYPATKSRADVVQACLERPFPDLATDPGATETRIPPCLNGEDDCNS